MAQQQVRRSFSESRTATGAISLFFRREKKINDLPPPTPPKDVDSPTTDLSHFRDTSASPTPIRHHNDLPALPIPSTSYAERTPSLSTTLPSVVDPADTFKPTSVPRPRPQAPPVRFDWSSGTSSGLNPEEKARRRIESERLREMEEQEAIEAEAERQARLKREKQDILKQEAEEAEERRIRLQEEIRQASFERSRKSKDEKEEEEKRMQEILERRMIEKEKRLAESKRIEEWRREHAKLSEALAKEQDYARKRAAEERRARLRSGVATDKIIANADSSCTGWLTVQTNDSLIWKRRFFKKVGNTMFLYRSPKVGSLPENS
jgi:hypothetical protein